MSAIWSTLLDWFLPTIRLPNDLHDLEASLTSNRIPPSHHRSLGSAPASGQDAPAYHRDHKSGRSSRRDSESDTHGHRSKAEYDDHYEMRKLQEENERLRKQVAQLQSQLESQPSSLTVSTTSSRVSSPPTTSPPVSPTSAVPPSTSSSSDYKYKYERLRKEHDYARQTLSSYNAELSSLRSFLSKTDVFDNASILQHVQDLNGQIQQFAATVAETYHGRLDVEPGYERMEDLHPDYLAIVEQVVGGRMVELLANRSHTPDPILLQYALQAWEVGCVSLVLDAFCFGAPEALDQTLSAIFKRMYVQEPVPTVARWRALTHSYLKTQLSQSSGILPTPVTPTSDQQPLNPREIDIQRHVERNLAGVQVLLFLAGYPTSRDSPLGDKLRDRHEHSLHLLCEEAVKIACSLREAFMSQFLEVVIVPPVGTQMEPTSRRKDRLGGLRIDVQQDVARFDAGAMLDVMHGSGPKPDNHDHVLCTVELGLATTSESEVRRSRERRSSEHASRSSLDLPQAISRTNSLGEPVQRELLRQIMLKPKVLLESFVRFLDHEQ